MQRQRQCVRPWSFFFQKFSLFFFLCLPLKTAAAKFCVKHLWLYVTGARRLVITRPNGRRLLRPSYCSDTLTKVKAVKEMTNLENCDHCNGASPLFWSQSSFIPRGLKLPRWAMTTLLLHVIFVIRQVSLRRSVNGKETTHTYHHSSQANNRILREIR